MQEAAINAILHTDYLGGQGLQIIRHQDALEVKNSGLLRVSPDHAQRGNVADSRNVGLTRLFFLIGVGSKLGKGLKGIYATWAKQGWNPPVLSESFRPETTSLQLPLRAFSKDRLQQKIVDVLTRKISAHPEDLSRSIGVSPVLIETALSSLLQDGLVSRSDRDGQDLYSLRA